MGEQNTFQVREGQQQQKMDALASAILSTSNAKGAGTGQKHVTETAYQEMLGTHAANDRDSVHVPSQDPQVLDSDSEMGQEDLGICADSMLAEFDMAVTETPKKAMRKVSPSGKSSGPSPSGKNKGGSAPAESPAAKQRIVHTRGFRV